MKVILAQPGLVFAGNDLTYQQMVEKHFGKKETWSKDASNLPEDYVGAFRCAIKRSICAVICSPEHFRETSFEPGTDRILSFKEVSQLLQKFGERALEQASSLTQKACEIVPTLKDCSAQLDIFDIDPNEILDVEADPNFTIQYFMEDEAGQDLLDKYIATYIEMQTLQEKQELSIYKKDNDFYEKWEFLNQQRIKFFLDTGLNYLFVDKCV